MAFSNHSKKMILCWHPERIWRALSACGPSSQCERVWQCGKKSRAR